MAKEKFILDVDTGVDDAVAILLAADADIDLVAITCVGGNTTIDKAVHNTLITLKVANKVIPVYKGCSEPLNVHSTSDGVFASDGLGGVADQYTPCDKSLQPGHAVDKLIELVDQYPGEITLVALGPQTNVAMAMRRDEKFTSKLKKLVIMGGNSAGKGNITMAAEFNFMVDPEAAKIVVEEAECDTEVYGWELCGLETTVPWEWYEKWMSKANDERGLFVKKMTESLVERRKEHWPDDGFTLCDPVPTCAAIYPEMVVESVTHRASVETQGRLTRGMMVIEWPKGTHPRKAAKAVKVVMKVDKKQYKQLLKSLM